MVTGGLLFLPLLEGTLVLCLGQSLSEETKSSTGDNVGKDHARPLYHYPSNIGSISKFH